MKIAAFVVLGLAATFAFLAWRHRPRRGHESGFAYVYVAQDGTARELSPEERAYLSMEFSGGDGGQPHIKSFYEDRDGWGSQSGFIARRSVPARITIEPVHPDYDTRVRELQSDHLERHRAAGDVIVTNPDGSTTCTTDSSILPKERFERARRYQLDEQKRREALAKVSTDGS